MACDQNCPGVPPSPSSISVGIKPPGGAMRVVFNPFDVKVALHDKNNGIHTRVCIPLIKMTLFRGKDHA